MASGGADCIHACAKLAQTCCERLGGVAELLPAGSTMAAACGVMSSAATCKVALGYTPISAGVAVVGTAVAVHKQWVKLDRTLKEVEKLTERAQRKLKELHMHIREHHKRNANPEQPFFVSEDVLQRLGKAVGRAYDECDRVVNLSKLAKAAESILNNAGRLEAAAQEMKLAIEALSDALQTQVYMLTTAVADLQKDAARMNVMLAKLCAPGDTLSQVPGAPSSAESSVIPTQPPPAYSTSHAPAYSAKEEASSSTSAPTTATNVSAVSAQCRRPSLTSSRFTEAMQLLNGVPGVLEPSVERAMDVLETAVDEVCRVARDY